MGCGLQRGGGHREQLELKTQLVTRDDFAWNLPSLPTSAPPPDDAAARGGTEEKEELRFIGGVDIR